MSVRVDMVEDGASMPPAPPLSYVLIAALVVVRLLLPVLTVNDTWGFNRDEFLYFAMADHFDLFRMQFPPLIAMVAAAGRAVFGESVLAARVPAAMAGAAIVAVVMLTVRRLGGGTRAGVFAWLAMLAAPVFIRPSVLMHPVVFDQLWATVALAALTLAAHEREPRWWLLVGAALGLGALTKFSVAFIGVSVVVTMLVVRDLRLQLATRWPWIAVMVALLIASPSISGQVMHDWPFLQQMKALRATQLDRVSPLEFLSGQLTLLCAAWICAAAALVGALRGPSRDRAPVVAAAVMVLLMLVLHGKDYYAAPVYPMLMVVGALQLERWARSSRSTTVAVAGAMLAGALVVWPIGVPAFDAAGMIRYAEAIGIGRAVKTNRGDVLQLPQDYADMLGWRELADSVGAVVRRLPADARADLTVVGANYGRAGALAFFRKRAGIPYPISTAGDFWAWGPGTATGAHAIVVADSVTVDQLKQLYQSVDVARIVENPLGVTEEQRVWIFYATKPNASLVSLWPKLGPNWD